MIAELIEKLPSLSLHEPVPKLDWPTLFQTTDARKIQARTLATLYSNFTFSHTRFVLNNFKDLKIPLQTSDYSELLSECKFVEKTWRPPYSYIVVTEDEDTYVQLKKQNILCYHITRAQDLEMCFDYDVIKGLDCDKFLWELEQLDNFILIDSVTQATCEISLQKLATWKQIAKVLSQHGLFSQYPIFDLLENENISFDKNEIVTKVQSLNSQLMNQIQSLSLSGDVLVSFMQSQSMPAQIESLIDDICGDEKFIKKQIPLEFDEESFETFVKTQRSQFYISMAKSYLQISHSQEIMKQLTKTLLSIDFANGMHSLFKNAKSIESGNCLDMKDCHNLFIENAQPISFHLTSNVKASILTGANSGGKTTLLEHIMQNLVLRELGLPSNGSVIFPQYDSVYYFAKNKGSTNKGAFETLLIQLSTIDTSGNTLILADEMEAVTEPSVAAKLMAKTISYYIEKKCDIVFATHLGAMLQPHMTSQMRIDGICAKGLDENHNVIIDHNPVLGTLANSTPELIIERLAKTNDSPFFSALLDS